MEVIVLLKPYVEIIYLISGPTLVFFAYKALEQIKVARETSRTQSRRESIRLAAERCEFFHKEVEPEITKFFSRLKEMDITFLEKCEVNIEAGKIKFKAYKDDEELKKLVNELDTFASLFNKLELFSMYFTGRIANEEFAYHALGKTYCKLVEKLIPLLMMNMFKDECRHIMSLFFVWHPRLEKINNQKRKDELKQELSELNEKEISDKKIEPIGTA
ncbi:hypothetical protein ACEUDP_20040 [Aeromonas caviae]|uniref:hypothetical protein n=1 Tax=Aeromonas caviae TaxID=648 RepID=UPI0038CFF039